MSMSHGNDSIQAGQEVPKCRNDDDDEGKEDKKSSSEANKKKDKDEAVTALLVACIPAAPNPLQTII